MSRDPIELRRAFTGLLATPVINRRSHPELWPLVWRHRATLIDWFANRLAYRLVVTDLSARLFRLPIAGRVTAPARYAQPSRRVLVLAILAAAAAEDAGDLTTTQELSDRVRGITQHPDVELAPYDPDRFAERLLFVRATEVLQSTGALWPAGRHDAERRENWAHQADEIGGALEVRRDLLLRMVDPASLAAALGEGPQGAGDEASARFSVMRRLIELPVCLREDLTDAERGYLANQQRRLIAWCEEMTGWVAEQRAEGIALIATEESGTDLPFPRLRALDFVTLILLDELLRRSSEGTGYGWFDRRILREASDEVRARYPKAITKELVGPDALETACLDLLAALDLVRVMAPGRWQLTAPAARFRDPRVESVTSRLDAGTDA